MASTLNYSTIYMFIILLYACSSEEGDSKRSLDFSWFASYTLSRSGNDYAATRQILIMPRQVFKPYDIICADSLFDKCLISDDQVHLKALFFIKSRMGLPYLIA